MFYFLTIFGCKVKILINKVTNWKLFDFLRFLRSNFAKFWFLGSKFIKFFSFFSFFGYKVKILVKKVQNLQLFDFLRFLRSKFAKFWFLRSELVNNLVLRSKLVKKSGF